MRSFVLLGAALVAGVLASFPVSAQQTIELKARFQEGMGWVFEQSQDMKQTMNIAAPGGQTQQMTSTAKTTRKGTLQVVAAQNGLFTSVRVAFDAACGGEMVMNGQTQRMPFALAGQTVMLSRSADGQLQTDYRGQLDPMTQMELNGYLIPPTSLFPPRPVTVGEEWDADTAQGSQQFQMSSGDQMRVHCKLTGIREVAGRQCAVIGMVMTIRKQGPQPLQGQTTGGSMIDLQSGAVLQADSASKMTMSGTQDMNGVTYNTTSEMTQVQHATFTPLEATRATPTGGAFLVPGTVPPAAQGGGVVGIFKDARLTMQVQQAEGKYTGTLKMGGQVFSFTATLADNALTGTFDSGGASFPFTATLEGDVLRFVTGGTIYQLKREGPPAAVNPLGAASPGESAPNPLGALNPGGPTAAPAPAGAPAPAAASDDYGYSKQNPIKLGYPEKQFDFSPRAEREYLARLRDAKGRPFRFARTGSVGPGPDGHVVDHYKLQGEDGQTVELYIDAYHPDAGIDVQIPRGLRVEK